VNCLRVYVSTYAQYCPHYLVDDCAAAMKHCTCAAKCLLSISNPATVSECNLKYWRLSKEVKCYLNFRRPVWQKSRSADRRFIVFIGFSCSKKYGRIIYEYNVLRVCTYTRMYLCIYVHVCFNVNIYVCIYIHIYIYGCTCARSYVRVYVECRKLIAIM